MLNITTNHAITYTKKSQSVIRHNHDPASRSTWKWAVIEELTQGRFWATYVNRKLTFCTLGQWFAQIFVANVLYKSTNTKRGKFGSINT